MTQLFKNNATAVLAAAITSTSQTSFVLVTGRGSLFPEPTGSDYFLATLDDGTNVEIVKCTARSADTLTVVRGQESTTARTWPAGTTLELRETAGTFAAIIEAIVSPTPGSNVQVNGAAVGSGAVGVVSIPIGTPPGSAPSGVIQLYADYKLESKLPVMTSDTLPSGTFSGSGYNTHDYWRVSNFLLPYGWLSTAVLPCWIQYQFPTAQTIKKYEIRCWDYSEFPNRNLTAWTLEGSNNGTSWTTLDTRTMDKADWVLGARTAFLVATPGSYTYYRINITDNGGTTDSGMKELALYGPSTTLTLWVMDGDGNCYELT